MSKPVDGPAPVAGTGKAAGVRPAPMFGPEGQMVLDEHGSGLFPVSVRPPFLRLLWLGLIALAVVLAVVLIAVAGRLP